MGRPRQSNAVKEAKGTQPCRMNKGEVAAPIGIGPPPDWLDESAQRVWDRIVALAPPNVLTTADAMVIEQLVLVALRLEECERTIAAEGMTLTETRGSGQSTYVVSKAHPLMPSLIQLRKQFLDMANRYGFTASSRASLSTESTKPPSRLAEFMQGRNKQSDE